MISFVGYPNPGFFGDGLHRFGHVFAVVMKEMQSAIFLLLLVLGMIYRQ